MLRTARTFNLLHFYFFHSLNFKLDCGLLAMPCYVNMKSLWFRGLLWLYLLMGFFHTVSSLEPGYLDFDNLPETNFSCVGKVIGGYYADLETNCQMFHVCTIGQLDEPMDIRFLCLNGTVFDQETRVCERIDEVDCSKSEQFYSLNLELYGNTQPSLVEDVVETEVPQPAKPSTSTTTTTTTPTPTTSKIITSHRFPAVSDIRFNPAEINISLNPTNEPESYGFSYKSENTQPTHINYQYHQFRPEHHHQFKTTYRPEFSSTTRRTHAVPTTYRSPYVASLKPPPPLYQKSLSLPPLTFSSPAPFTLTRHVETKRYTNNQQPPRIIISASASVSDASGRRLNYSLGTIGVTPLLEEPPKSYDDYKDTDVVLDPFYQDVPKLKPKRRKRQVDIIKNEQEAVDVLKFLFDWYRNHERTTQVPKLQNARNDHNFSIFGDLLSVTEAIQTTIKPTQSTEVSHNSEDYVDDNYEPLVYQPPKEGKLETYPQIEESNKNNFDSPIYKIEPYTTPKSRGRKRFQIEEAYSEKAVKKAVTQNFATIKVFSTSPKTPTEDRRKKSRFKLPEEAKEIEISTLKKDELSRRVLNEDLQEGSSGENFHVLTTTARPTTPINIEDYIINAREASLINEELSNNEEAYLEPPEYEVDKEVTEDYNQVPSTLTTPAQDVESLVTTENPRGIQLTSNENIQNHRGRLQFDILLKPSDNHSDFYEDIENNQIRSEVEVEGTTATEEVEETTQIIEENTTELVNNETSQHHDEITSEFQEETSAKIPDETSESTATIYEETSTEAQTTLEIQEETSTKQPEATTERETFTSSTTTEEIEASTLPPTTTEVLTTTPQATTLFDYEKDALEGFKSFTEKPPIEEIVQMLEGLKSLPESSTMVLTTIQELSTKPVVPRRSRYRTHTPRYRFSTPRHRFSSESFTPNPFRRKPVEKELLIANNPEPTEEIQSTNVPLYKSAHPTQKEALPTTPMTYQSQKSKPFIFNCFQKAINKFYSDPRDCRLFHYCTNGYTKNQLLDMKFVCDLGTYFDDVGLICTKNKPSRCL